MTTSRTQAAKLLSAAEMAVFDTSLAPAIRELGAARLAGKVKRARTLRDKFRDLLQRQTVATRRHTGTKSGPVGNANERTAKKAEIFDEVLQRYSARLAQVRAAAAREAARAEKAATKKASAARTAARSAAPKAAKKSAPKAPTKPVRSGAASTLKAAVAAAVEKKAAPKRAAGKPPPRSAKAPATAPGAAGGGVGPGSPRARAAAKDARLAAARQRPIEGHISSTVRRAQARRDAKD